MTRDSHLVPPYKVVQGHTSLFLCLLLLAIFYSPSLFSISSSPLSPRRMGAAFPEIEVDGKVFILGTRDIRFTPENPG